jgi:hypothetical protein
LQSLPEKCGGDRWALESVLLTIFVADARRDDGRRLVVHADEKLTAFIELESVIHTR